MKERTTNENNCMVCPRLCAADRFYKFGFCGAPVNPMIASVMVHPGEEPQSVDKFSFSIRVF